MIQMILLRMWRERRLMLILLIGMSLVTSFLALGPLYVRTIAAAEFEGRLANARGIDLRVDISSEQAIPPDIRETFQRTMGQRIAGSRPFSDSTGAHCGFQYNPDAPPGPNSPRTTATGCYLSYAYPEFDALFTLAEGRNPVAGAPNGVVEAVITDTMQADAGWQVGQRLVYGEDFNTAVTVEIVGIVAPQIPRSDPFWEGQTIFEAFTFFTSAIDSREERSFIVTQADMTEYLNAAHETTRHLWRILLEPDAIGAGEIDAVDNELRALTGAVRADYPQAQVTSTLDDLLQSFRENVASTQAPITFLSALVLIPMLYSMVTIAALTLQQQMGEWAMFASRGGSRTQLLAIQFVTVGLLNLVAVIFGPLLALGLLFFLTLVGPQAAIVDPVHMATLSPDVLALSLVAALALQVALMLPAWDGANASLLHLQRGRSRPTTQPAWARYGLDAVLILGGVALLVRLYTLATGASATTLLSDPSLLLRTLAQGEIELLLSDPFNLAAPALLLTGLTLLWMRLFPLLIGLIGRLSERSNGLLLRLALWSIERDPAHYTRMVLLLIGTLALGTASLTLSATRDAGAWTVARSAVGADAAVTLADPTTVEWEALPDVLGAASLFLLEPQSPQESILLGIDSAALSADFDDLAEIAPLLSAAESDLGGARLLQDAVAVRLDAYLAAPADGEPAITTELGLLLVDGVGRESELWLTPDAPQVPETFQSYSAELPQGVAPFWVQGFILDSEQEGNTIRHSIVFDNLRGVAPDGAETLALSFSAETYGDIGWRSDGQGLPSATLFTETDLTSEGADSLRVQYVQRTTRGLQPPVILGYRSRSLEPLPVVLSPQMAVALSQRARMERPLRAGDSNRNTFDVASPSGPVRINLSYEVLAVRDLNSLADRSVLLLLADQRHLQQHINAGEGASLNAQADTVWLALAGREPSAATLTALDALEQVESVEFAWDRYSAFLREPLPNAISGVLFAGFWVSLLLSLMDFAFYLAVTTRQRAPTFAMLRALGWGRDRLPQLLLWEQALFVLPALVVGVLVGIALAALIVPFLALTGSQALRVPVLSVALMLLVLVLAFVAVLRLTAAALRQVDLNRVLRFGE